MSPHHSQKATEKKVAVKTATEHINKAPAADTRVKGSKRSTRRRNRRRGFKPRRRGRPRRTVSGGSW